MTEMISNKLGGLYSDEKLFEFRFFSSKYFVIQSGSPFCDFLPFWSNQVLDDRLTGPLTPMIFFLI